MTSILRHLGYLAAIFLATLNICDIRTEKFLFVGKKNTLTSKNYSFAEQKIRKWIYEEIIPGKILLTYYLRIGCHGNIFNKKNTSTNCEIDLCK